MSENFSSEEIKKLWPNNAPPISNIQKYVEKYKEDTIVIKYGGNVLIDREVFNNFILDIQILNRLGLSIVVVHGGGPRIKRELEKSNIESRFINGLRVTDQKIINIVEKVLIEFNRDIVESLNNKIPVVAPLGLDEKNQVYNINGDTAAGAIAKSLKSRRLLLMTNVEGVLDKEKKLITEISSEKTLELIKDQTISGGMIPKINTCLDAVNNGVRGVVIIDGRKPHSILNEIFSDSGAGTLIR